MKAEEWKGSISGRVREILLKAGEIILGAHVERRDIRAKGGKADFVTAYDVRVQEYLIGQLASLIPDAAFFGEEDTKGSGRILGNGPVFIIDPIDGTTNFMFDRRHSCISVALCCDRRVCFAWVYQPYTGELWTAEEGAGAFLNGERLHPADLTLEEGVAAFGAARHYGYDPDPLFRLVRNLFEHSLGVREGGSAAIDLCRVAAGGNICYLEPMISPWDYAASSLILREAGCLITQWSGERITLDRSCSILAAPPQAYGELRRLIDRDKADHVHLGKDARPGKGNAAAPSEADLIEVTGEEDWQDETERTYRDGSLIQECWKDRSY